MKKYTVAIDTGYEEIKFSIHARNEDIAKRKAVRQCRSFCKDVTAQDVVKVTYEGFYLARRFFAVRETLSGL